MKNYIVATIKPWNIDAFHRHTKNLPGNWALLTKKEELTLDFIKTFSPRYIFFPHWSWIVPEEIINTAECVCFHMADVPYGRGGSPLQNLISRGHKKTRLSALRMVQELDAGPVYVKKDLSLEGRAQKIFEDAADITYDIIKEIITLEPDPKPQQGEPVVFKRRTENMSILPETGSLQDLFDHIRMLDAETYPRAFIKYGQYKMVFDCAKLTGEDTLEAKVTITLDKSV